MRLWLLGLCAGTASSQALGDGHPGLPDDVADVVLGQPGMAYPFPNRTDAQGLIEPCSLAVDTSVKPYRLYVVDAGNHRVLGYRSPLSERRPAEADLVIGQPDLYTGFFNELKAGPNRLLTPASVTVDGQGNVYVSDSGYHRILEFDRPFETDTTADRVFGQGESFDSFSPNQGGASAGSLASPHGICIDPRTGNLWVADAGNNRVLCFLSPLTTDPLADRVIGQSDFKTTSANAGGLSANSLYAPMGVAVTGRHLIVSDSGNKRVLIYTDPLGTDTTADHVLGQDGSFQRAESGCSPFRFAQPTAVTAEPSDANGAEGRLLVSDTGNSRILMFGPPGSANPQPISLWGQGTNLHGAEPNQGGPGPGSLCFPLGTAIAPDGTLWVADGGNHRVLAFDQGIEGDRAADHVIGQIDLVHHTPNFVDGWGLSSPRDVAIDRSAQPNRLYVCDFNNNRILGYASTDRLGPGTPPALVIGQSDRYSNDPGVGRAALSSPAAVAVDATGNLFVVDRDNSRVLWFARPFETDTVADRVFGQPDVTSGQPNTGGVSARSLNRPEGVAVDGHGSLYVADTRNHRILRFDRPMETDTVADAVWGQQGSFTKGAEYGGIGVRSDTLSYPFGLDVGPDGLLAVADTNNHRVLLFDTRGEDPFRAMKVFGQGGDFTSHRDNLGGCSAHSLSGPEGVAFWDDGLFVADTANCRLLWYNDRGSRGDRASFVYGQSGSFQDNRRGMGLTGARNLWLPGGVDVDSRGNLYVADREQSRVLVFTRDEPALAGPASQRSSHTRPAAP